MPIYIIFFSLFSSDIFLYFSCFLFRVFFFWKISVLILCLFLELFDLFMQLLSYFYILFLLLYHSINDNNFKKFPLAFLRFVYYNFFIISFLQQEKIKKIMHYFHSNQHVLIHLVFILANSNDNQCHD